MRPLWPRVWSFFKVMYVWGLGALDSNTKKDYWVNHQTLSHGGGIGRVY